MRSAKREDEASPTPTVADGHIQGKGAVDETRPSDEAKKTRERAIESCADAAKARSRA